MSPRLPPTCYPPGYERSGKRRRSDCAALRQTVAEAAEDASPITRQGRRGGPTRNGEASARSPAQDSQAGLTAAAWSTWCGPFMRAHGDGLALRRFWVNGSTFGAHCVASSYRGRRAALTVSAPDTTILAIGSDRLPAARQPWQERQPAPQRRAVARQTPHPVLESPVCQSIARQARQRRKARRRCLAVRGLVRLSV
jgi:hypothetical protein